MITVSIDVTKLDKSRIKNHENGSKYLNLTLIDTPNSQYGDHFMVVQSSSKEEREQGIKLPPLGNGKDWDRERDQAPQQQAQQQAPPINDDDIPF